MKMMKIWTLYLSFSMNLTGCGINSLLVPAVGIPTSNYLTRSHYEGKYAQYDKEYREKASFKEHAIPRASQTIYAREFGDDGNDNKPTIILMHGFPDSLHLYDRLAPLLSEHFRVVSFDFLGWGASDKPDDHTYNTASLYQDLDAVIRYFDLEKVSLVVHDASGPPGIEWAMNNAERMDILVMLNTYYHRADGLIPPEAIATFSTPSVRRTIIRTGAKISDYGWKVGYQNQLEKFFHDEKQKDIMLPVFTHQAMDIRRAFFQLNEVLHQEAAKRTQNKHRLSEYQGSVAIIFGVEDPYLNMEVAKDFNDLFPNSSLYLIDNAAHFVQLDKPGEVATKILESLNIVRHGSSL